MVNTQCWYGSCCLKCGISSHGRTQLPGVSRCSCCTGMTQQEHTGDSSLCLLFSVFAESLPSASPGAPFLTGTAPNSADTAQKFSRCSCASHPPGSAPGPIHTPLWTSHFLSWLFAAHNGLAEPLAEQLLKGSPSVPSVPSLPAQTTVQTWLALVFSSKDAFGPRLELGL